ncbi:hypothetical protein ACEWY4_020470 [Coilia grayii]|uniref:Ig-like domain-containing protein n=1 Tax=Coilia grayii TaxID=363190 RepID=A0ABD1JCQ1_9TELE
MLFLIPPSAFHVLPGSTVVLDCEGLKNTGAEAVKWSLRKDVPSKSEEVLITRTKHGIFRHHTLKSDDRRRTILTNMSLVINSFDKEDEGVYVCEVCPGTPQCICATSQCIIDPLVVVSERGNISVSHIPKVPNGHLNCTVTVTDNRRNVTDLNTNNTAYAGDAAYDPDSSHIVLSVWLCLAAVAVCCLVALLATSHRQRRGPVTNTECPTDDGRISPRLEEELLYTSVCLPKSDGRILRSSYECVYSDIKVQRGHAQKRSAEYNILVCPRGSGVTEPGLFNHGLGCFGDPRIPLSSRQADWGGSLLKGAFVKSLAVHTFAR